MLNPPKNKKVSSTQSRIAGRRFDPAWSRALAWKSAGESFCVLRTSSTRRPDAEQKFPLDVEGRVGADADDDGRRGRPDPESEEFRAENYHQSSAQRAD